MSPAAALAPAAPRPLAKIGPIGHRDGVTMRQADRGALAPMRGALRTLQVLRALNVKNGATVIELSRYTGISRGALYRLLETLREEGYVALDLARRRYRLTILVRGLAEGFSDDDWVRDVARPAILRLQKEVLWPVDFGTFADNAMWIRETTRPLSPFTIDRIVVGVRFPMLRSATGRTYLAWCPDDEREEILRNLFAAREPGHELIADRATLDAMLDRTRAAGFGARTGELASESGAIAVPILVDARVIGCLTLTFICSAMNEKEAASRYLGAIRACAAEIAAGVMRHRAGDTLPAGETP